MWKSWITLLSTISILISTSHSHCVRNGTDYEEIICTNLSFQQLQLELNNVLNNVITTNHYMSGLRVLVSTKLVIENVTLETINTSLFTNSHMANIQELEIINSKVKIIEPNAFQNMLSLKSIKLMGNYLQHVNGKMFPNYVRYINLNNNNIQQIHNFCQIKSHLSELIVSNNKISKIDNNVFYNCTNLKLLTLDNCNIKNIEANAFSKIYNLNYLNVSYNKLSLINITLNCNLNSLDAGNNNLVNFKLSKMGENCVALATLNLENNNISELNFEENYIISHLKSFNFRNNPINTDKNKLLYNNIMVDNFKAKICKSNGYDQVYDDLYLNLSGYGIEKLDRNFFKSCSRVRVREINLYKNNITKLQSYAFDGLDYLRILNLTENKIIVIEPGAFNMSTSFYNQIQELYLSNLTNFKADSFLGLSNIKTLSIINSDFDSVESAALRYMPALNKILLYQNNIKLLEPFAFSGSPHLNYLNLSHNNYEFIQPGVFLNSHITILDMSFSTFKVAPKLEKIFEGLNNLDILSLKYINLESIYSTDFCHLKQLRYLDLHGNKLSEIPSSAFRCLPNLYHLSLKVNRIFEISSDSFTNLKNLNMLDLSDNNIKTLEVGTFRDLGNLSELHLEFNHLVDFKIGTFSALNNLVYLNVSNNRLKTFSETVFFNLNRLQYLDLRNNLIVSNYDIIPIVHLERLRYLGISGNYWRCNVLVRQLKFLKDKHILYKSSYEEIDYDYEKINVDGIYCS